MCFMPGISMAVHVVSSAPLATQVLGVAVEQTSVPPLPVQSPETRQAKQAAWRNFNLAASMVGHVASLVAAKKYLNWRKKKSAG